MLVTMSQKNFEWLNRTNIKLSKKLLFLRDFLNHRKNDISYDAALERAAIVQRVIKGNKVVEYLNELTEALQIGKRDDCICGIFTMDPLDYFAWVHRHDELTAAIETHRPK